MKSGVIQLLVVALFCYLPSGVSFADEHPKGEEHPKADAQKGDEHPKADAMKGDEHPKGAKGESTPKRKPKKKKSDAPSSSWNPKTVETELIALINKQKAESDGMFVVKDENSGNERKLSLDKIHTDKIVQLSDGTSFVCADFKDASGETVDVDFFITPTSRGAVANVERVQIHKVNGQPRYTYVKNGNAWVQQTVN